MAASSNTCTPARSPATTAASSATSPELWETSPMFTDAQQRALVEVARSAVTGAIAGRSTPAPRAEDLGELPEATGAFVTLKRDGHLRGCIGTLECRRPLPEEV